MRVLAREPAFLEAVPMQTKKCCSLEEARTILGGAVLGAEEARRVWQDAFSIRRYIPEMPEIPYSADFLDAHRETHVLVFGFPVFPNGTPCTFANLRKRFGTKQNGVCFSAIGLSPNAEDAWAVRPLRPGWWLMGKVLAPESLGESYETCREIAREHGWEMPHVVDAVYAAILVQLMTGKRVLQHNCTWCADVVGEARLRLGYNQPRNGFHVAAYPPHERSEYWGFLPIVPPELS